MSQWPVLPLGEFADFLNGFPFKPEDWDTEGVPIIRIQNLTGSKASANKTTRKVPEKYIVLDGDLLVSWSGSLGVYIWAGGPALLNQHIFKATPRPHVDKKFLFYSIQQALDVMRSKTHGSTMIHIKKGDFEALSIPLPPLVEQRRIVDILNHASSIRRLRQQALEKTRALIPAMFNNIFGDPASNPRAWQKLLLDDLLTSIDSGQSPKCHDRKKLIDEWGVLRLSAVTSCVYNEQKHKTLPAEIETDPSVEIKSGDVLLTRKNTYELVGACAFVWETSGRILLPDLIFRLNIQNPQRLHPVYLWQLLTTNAMRVQLRKLASGSAGSMPNISKQRLRTLEVIVPSFEAQSRFADAVIDLHSLIAQQERHLVQAEALLQSLMARFFNGTEKGNTSRSVFTMPVENNDFPLAAEETEKYLK